MRNGRFFRASALVGGAAVMVLAFGCSQVRGPAGARDRFGSRIVFPAQATREHPMAIDAHSHARPDEVRVRHVHLDLDVDFLTKTLSGTATLTLERSPDHADAPLYLDARHLEVEAVRSGRPPVLATTAFALGDADPILGSALRIDLRPGDTHVEVRYRTTEAGEGLQWLDPEQTAGKRRPFLFSQSQAIHARSWIPCQDTPGVRVTYSATVRVPEDLQCLMSAERTSPDGARGTFTFDMPQPIPSYLIALAVGDLAFRELGPRSGVWAEPNLVDAAADEFADTEQMIAAIERLYGPYRWGRYDILVLPPSFPFGGMENPRMTFATPTILAGDRSLVSLVAHELAHSWSGNLVTNATWRDFWLNEGFTVYLEQRVIEELYGVERFRMETSLAFDALREEMADLAPRDQILHVDLAGRDPDDGFTGVPYDKGAAFLRLLERTFGRETFDDFLERYFDAFAFQSITTERFVEFLRENLFAAHPDAASRIDVERWIEEPGIPEDFPVETCEAFARIDTVRENWLSGRIEARAIDTAQWTTHEWLHFIRGLEPRQPVTRLAELDAAFGLTGSKNSEIAAAWLELAIRSDYAAAYGRLEEFLVGVGRRKFLKPLYVALCETDAGRELARRIYARARAGYHAIARQTIDEIVGFGPRTKAE